MIEFVPWDEEETREHMKYKWISNPQATYGTYFDAFCKPLDHQTPLSLMKKDCTATSKVKEEQEGTEREAILQEQEREERAGSKHTWISNPHETYGDYYDAFCSSFDPTKPLVLMTGDFMATTQVKEQYQRMIQDFVAPTKAED
jgi:hypothetical protein